MLGFNLGGLSMSLDIDASGLERQREYLSVRYQRDMKDALRVVVRDREKRLEDAFKAAGLGKLARGWASAVYPEGEKLAQNPAAEVYPKGGTRTRQAFRAFLHGARITPRGGAILWIPTAAAGRGFKNREQRGGPEEWERRNPRRKLQVYVKPDGTILLFDPGDDEATAAKRESRGWKVRKRVLVFVGIRAASLSARVSLRQIMMGAGEQLKHEFLTRARKAGE